MENQRDQDNLFGWGDSPPSSPPRYPAIPGFKGGETSREAAEAIMPAASNLRGKVLREIRDNPGMTADEIATKLHRTPFSIRPRVSELHASGLIEPSEERGKNESGMSARRWRVKVEVAA